MRRFAWFLIFVGLVITIACSHKIESDQGAPSVESSDLKYCGADEQAFVIRGKNLSPMVEKGATDKPQLDMPEVCLRRVADVDGNPVSGEKDRCIPDEDVEWVSTSELRFTTRSSLGLTPGNYEVLIRNPDGQEATGGKVRIVVLSTGPLVFWADPNVLYNGISTQMTAFGTNLGEVGAVRIRNTDTRQETTLNFTQIGTRENRVQALVPSGTPVGTYDILVERKDGCLADLIRGVRVTDQVNLTVSAIDPTFGWANADTPVTISGDGFSAVPRAYLNPHNATAGAVAAGLTSVAFVSAQRITGVVPKSLPTGLYDLIVVNPDGRVGLLDSAFTVTADVPPVVTNVSPSYLDNQSDKAATIDGENFRSPTVTMRCRAPDGTEQTLNATVGGTTTATRIDATLPTTGLVNGTVCIIRVTNVDGSYFDFSAVGISNPSANLNAFRSGPPMATARRAPAVVAGRATRAARFVYAIGGDNGTTAGAFDTVETSAIDIFGEPSPWYEQPVKLPGARTLAGAVTIGRFLYLVGGNDGSAVTGSTLRAQVLDPLAAPKIVDVAARKADNAGQGIGPGVWYYRVSAVMADADPSNPSGETLPSDPLVISLPAELKNNLVLTLIWDPVPGAKAYRIYRSPTGDLPVGSERRLAEVAGQATTTYEDIAPPGAIGGPPPLPLGATGVWVAMSNLGTAREAFGITTAADPATANLFHIYAVGGRAGAALGTYEHLGVTVNTDGTQTSAAWVAGGGGGIAARSELSAFTVSHDYMVQVSAGTSYVYAAGGAGSTATDVAQVNAGGALGAWTTTDAMSPAHSGYAGISGAGFLVAFGGLQSGPDDGVLKAEVNPASIPLLINWNSDGGSRLAVPRFLAGSAHESAFVYIVGGNTTGDQPTNAMERTVL